MGNSASLPDDVAPNLADETGFSNTQLKRLYNRFKQLDHDKDGKVTCEDIKNIPELHKNPLTDHVVHAVFKTSVDGSNLTFNDFARVMACFRPIQKNKENMVNSREAKLKFAFSMYDIDDTGYITRDELLDVLHAMVGANVSAEQLENICDRTIKEADKDGDNQISFEEFTEVLQLAEIEIKMAINYD